MSSRSNTVRKGQYNSNRRTTIMGLTSLENGEQAETLLFNQPQPIEAANTKKDAKIEKLKKEVEEVVEIVASAVSQLEDRGPKLEKLNETSEGLKTEAESFKLKADLLAKKQAKRNVKICLFAIIISLIILAVLGVTVYFLVT